METNGSPMEPWKPSHGSPLGLMGLLERPMGQTSPLQVKQVSSGDTALLGSLGRATATSLGMVIATVDCVSKHSHSVSTHSLRTKQRHTNSFKCVIIHFGELLGSG